MCLAIPGKITETYDREGIRMAKVDFGGIAREACLAYVPEAVPGQYVMVHVGFAISAVNEEEARRTFEYLEQLGQLGEIQDEIPG
jgi:hydrogenase expression/formation protein HypC